MPADDIARRRAGKVAGAVFGRPVRTTLARGAGKPHLPAAIRGPQSMRPSTTIARKTATKGKSERQEETFMRYLLAASLVAGACAVGHPRHQECGLDPG
jgi:hypothetical protein